MRIVKADNRDVYQIVCDEIAEGASVQKGCDAAGIAVKTFYRRLAVDDELGQKYTRARESRADVRFENAQNLKDDILSGLIDPMQAKVLLDLIKWQCGKEKAKVYGDSTTIKGDKDNPLTLQALSSALDDRVKHRIEHKPDSD